MTIEADIKARLDGFAPLAALVGDRTYGHILPQGVTLPAITFFRVSAQRFSSMSVDAQIKQAIFQFDVWAATYAEADGARPVADQVIAALQRHGGAGTVTWHDSYIENEQDLFEPDADDQGNGKGIHRVSIDVRLFYG